VPSVVLDACVLFPPTLRNTLLHAAAFGLFRPYWGEEILDELRRNLVERAPMSDEKDAGWIAKMREHFPEACTPIDAEQAASLENHPKDRHVLAVAIAVEADAIVTRNLMNFPKAALAPHGIEAWPPDTLLTVLFQRDPMRVVDVVRFYAESQHTPPRTTQNVLGRLAKDAPRFTRAVSRLLRQT
jgi:predicted nucleic acid-binding protein